MSIRPFRNQVLRSRGGGSSSGLRAARRAHSSAPEAPVRLRVGPPQAAGFAGPAPARPPVAASAATALPAGRLAAARQKLAVLAERTRSALHAALGRRRAA